MLTVYAEEDKIFESMCNGEIAHKVVTLFQKTAADSADYADRSINQALDSVS